MTLYETINAGIEAIDEFIAEEEDRINRALRTLGEEPEPKQEFSAYAENLETSV